MKYGAFLLSNSDKNASIGLYKDDQCISDNYPSSDFKLDSFQKIVNPLIYKDNLTKDTGIMPPGVLAITESLVVFERPPEYKNIFIIPRIVNDIHESNKVHTYRIAVPWQLYIVQYMSYNNPDTGEQEMYAANVKMHFMKSNLYSVDQELYMAPLPNFYTNGNLCRPMYESMDDINRYSKDIAGVIQSAYDWIWNSGTNLDLTESVLQGFMQSAILESNNIETLLTHRSESNTPYIFNHGQYYCGYDPVQYMLLTWEKIPLEQILNIEWPRNSRFINMNEERHYLIKTKLVEYFQYIGLEPIYEFHFDEETSEEYQCDIDNPENDDELCSCRIPINSYNINKFMEWTGEYPPVPVSFSESCDLLLDYFSLNNNSAQYSDYTARWQIKSMINTSFIMD